jgi:putative membrane protein
MSTSPPEHAYLIDLLDAGDIDRPWKHGRMSWIVRFFANALGLVVAAWILDGIQVSGDTDSDQVITLLLVALIFGLVNSFVRPVVNFLSIPLYILTLGLMYFVVNALMLMLTSWLADKLDIGFSVDGFWIAVVGGIIIALVTWGVTMLLPDTD